MGWNLSLPTPRTGAPPSPQSLFLFWTSGWEQFNGVSWCRMIQKWQLLVAKMTLGRMNILSHETCDCHSCAQLAAWKVAVRSRPLGTPPPHPFSTGFRYYLKVVTEVWAPDSYFEVSVTLHLQLQGKGWILLCLSQGRVGAVHFSESLAILDGDCWKGDDKVVLHRGINTTSLKGGSVPAWCELGGSALQDFLDLKKGKHSEKEASRHQSCDIWGTQWQSTPGVFLPLSIPLSPFSILQLFVLLDLKFVFYKLKKWCH